MNATIQALYLPALAQFAAKGDTRYYLNGFLIEPAPKRIGGVYLVATDGYTICVIHDQIGSSEGTYIMRAITLLKIAYDTREAGGKVIIRDGNNVDREVLL